MTKEMETSAGLLIAASSYATKNLDDSRSREVHERLHYAFIAGAEWQKSQLPERRAGNGAFLDTNSGTVKIEVNAEDWEGMKGKLAEFELMRKDRNEAFLRIGKLKAKLDAAEIARRDWADTATEYAQKLHAARVRIGELESLTHIGVDPAAPGSDRTVIAVCKAYERAMDDMGSLGTGVMSLNGDGTWRHVDLREFLATTAAYEPEAKSEATGGFTATGDTAADNGEMPRPCRPTIEQRVAHLEQYVFGDAPGIDPDTVDTQGNWRT